MTEETRPPTAPGDIDVHFVALVNLLAQMSAQLLQEGRVAEARGLIDGLAALEIKTKGNLVDAEGGLLSSVLYQLRMAAVSAKEKTAEDDEGEAEEPAGGGEGDGPAEEPGRAGEGDETRKDGGS